MRRDKLFGNKFMRLSACALMAFACAFNIHAQNISSAPINPAFKQWQKERRYKRNVAIAKTNVVRQSNRRLRTTVDQSAIVEPTFGYVPEVFDTSYLGNLNIDVQRGMQDPLPKKYDDLRDKGIIPSVRNQSPYGTCWAHAACASLETGLISDGIGAIDLSEKNMALAHGFDWDFEDGGNGDIASAYLLRWEGPVIESQDPYPDRTFYDKWYYDNHYWDDKKRKWIQYDPLKYSINTILPPSENIAPFRHVQNIRWVLPRTAYLDNDNIKESIRDYGTIWVGYYHSDGYYNPDTAAYYFNGNTLRSMNHAVALVGWDDDYLATNFGSPPPGNGAFIVRNSWGTSWGDGGYFYVSYYDESFAWKNMYAFSLTEDSCNYEAIYQYDRFGIVSSVGYGNSMSWGANIFTATNATRVAAVGFYALTPNTSFTIKIYKSPETDDPTTGTLGTTQNGKTTSAGFFTIPLTEPQEVTARQRFSVVLQLVIIPTPDTYPIAFEYAKPGYTSDATASAGQSFISSDGETGNWLDLTDWKGSANVCIKAYTLSAPPPKPSLLSIVVKPEDDKTMSLKPGDKVQMKCEATYSNNAKSNVTDVAQWSLTSGRSYATLSSGGLLTAKNEAVLEPQTITVQAVYAEDGIIATNRYGFSMAETPPEAPTDVTATQGTDTSCIHVNWTAPAGATEYAVYRAAVNNIKNVYHLENVNVAKYHDTGSVKPIVPGVDYWYFIKAKNANPKASEYSTPGAMGWCKLSPPESESVIASDNLLDKVSLEWGKVEGATHYRVYRADEFDGEKTAISGWQTARTFDDVPPEKDVPYYYYVVAAVDASGNRPSDYSIVEDGMMVSPVTVDHLEIKGDASIASGGYADYTADAIYTDGHRVENVTPSRWEIVGEGASVVNGRVAADVVTENKKVVLLASYTENGKIAPGEKEIAIVAVKPNAPRNVTAVAVATSATLPGRIEIAWSAVAGAAQYVVYRDGGVVGRVIPNAPGGVIETTFSDSTAIPGVTYSYTVSAANGAGEGPQSSSVSATIPLPAPTGVTATSDRTDGVLVDWRRVRDNAPYQSGTYYFRVARATSEAGVKTELGSWTTDLTYLDAASPVNTPLYYFVRAATTSSGTNAGDWSVPVVGRVIPNAPTLLSISISGPDRVSASGTALYSCAASYDDNTEPTVSPRWSVSPSSAATIDPSGMLTASAVSSDTEVTVTAAYDGKTATKKVKVIAPVVTASASVSNVRVTPRWPFSTLVDIDYTLATAPVGTMAHITLSGQDNDHNLPLAARTLTGDGASGVVAAGERRITWNIGADYPNLHVKSLDVALDAMPCVIAAPANLTASAGTSSYAVELTWDAVTDATGYEIWRSVSPSAANASNIVTVADGTTYSDTDANAMQPYFYWVKTVTEYGTSDFGDYVYGYRLPPASGTVTLDPNGGTVSETSLSYTVGTAYGTLPRAMRSGYNFVGWFTAKDGGTEVTAYTIATDSIPTLYAHWTPCEYFVRFNANGGTGTMADMRVYHGVTTNLSANAYSRSGCLFAGWATNENGAVVYVDRASITPSTNMTLYASWTIPLQYALDNDGLSFTTGGNAEWTGVFDDSAANGSAAKSGKITHSQSTWLRTTVVGKGTLSYRCKTSCESSFDKLTLTIDGRQYGTASGNGSGFNTLVYSVTNAGTHTVTWTYSKDSSVSQGDDCVWIDKVEWTPILLSASSGTSTDGIELEWEPAANVSSYIVWRSDTTNRTDAVAVNMAGASATRYVDTSAMPGVQYHYWLQVFTTSGALVDIGSAVVGWRNFTAPTNLTVTEGTYTNRVVMSFDAVEGAMFYEFYMSQTNNLSTAQYIGYMYSTNSHVTAAYSAIDAGVRYYFWVRVMAVTPNGEGYARLGDGMMSGSASGYIKKYYEVSFNANGGVGTMPRQDILIGATTNLAVNAFTRTGYLFTGWATQTNGVVAYSDSASITPTADMVLYAKWTANTYTVTLNMQGGSGGTSSVTATYGSAMPSVTPPTRTDYTFGGYYTGTGGSGIQYYTASGVSARTWDKTTATTLYAYWEAPDLDFVAFDGWPSSVFLSSQKNVLESSSEFMVGSTIYLYCAFGNVGNADIAANYTIKQQVLNASGQEVSSFSFDATSDFWLASGTRMGWGGNVIDFLQGLPVGSYTYKCTLDSGGTIVENVETNNVVTIPFTVYANPNVCEIRFDANGGTGTMSAQDVVIGTTTNLQSNAFRRSGFVFAGWATTSNGDVVYVDGSSVVSDAAEAGKTVTLYAVWLAAPSSVSATDATFTNEVRVTWSSVAHATCYQVWRGTTSSSSSATQIGYNVTDTSYSDTTALVGTNYYYWVKAVCGSVVSSFSGSDVGRRMIAAPSGVTVATDSTGTNLVVSWSGAVSGAAKYEIWRATYTQTSGGSVTTSASLSRIATVDAIVPASGGGTSSSGLPVKYTPAHPRTSYTDHPNLSGNKFYRYQVKAVGGSNTSAASNYSEIRTYKNAGTYSLSLPLTANYSIAAVGGGGGGAQCAHSSLIGFNTAGGGSGAYYKGVLNLAKGSYKVNVGGAGAASVQNYSTWADADNGGQTKLAYSTGSSYLISAGGGGGGSVSGTSATGGSGGTVSIGSSTTVVSTSSNVSGKVGDAQRQVASGSANGGASVYGGYGVGGNNVSDGGVGFFQIVINE